MPKILKFRTYGFTLIELLVVMGIIALLSMVSLFVLQSSRQAGRDGKRKADLGTIQSALELYKADCSIYPSSITFSGTLAGSAGGCTPANSNVYLQTIPNDPAGGSATYYYNQLNSGAAYQLCANLEGLAAATLCTGGGNYKVTNP